MTFRGQSPSSLRDPSRLSRLKGSNGFTLVELLIGAALSGAVMAAVLSSYLYLGRNLTRLANQQALETQSRRALGYFTQDVQRATEVDTGTTVSASTVRLKVPSTTDSSATVTYTFTNDASGNGTLVRTPSSGTAQTLLRYITDGGFAFRYYDASGNPYDNGSSPYTTSTDYLPGIKQLSMQFSTQTGLANIGTQTLVHKVASSRLDLRNRGFLQ